MAGVVPKLVDKPTSEAAVVMFHYATILLADIRLPEAIDLGRGVSAGGATVTSHAGLGLNTASPVVDARPSPPMTRRIEL
jgi:hypothetical protein